MTEDEAKTKWCPFAKRTIWGISAGVNRDGGGDNIIDSCECIGSKCMAWRYIQPPHKKGDIFFTTDHVVCLDKHKVTFNKNTAERDFCGTGYCGLAGRTEE